MVSLGYQQVCAPRESRKNTYVRALGGKSRQPLVFETKMSQTKLKCLKRKRLKLKCLKLLKNVSNY